jgi:putative acetyltransferase
MYSIKPIDYKDINEFHLLRLEESVIIGTLSYPAIRFEKSESFYERLSENDHVFGVYFENKLIASFGITISSTLKTRHTGYIGLNVSTVHQGKGVGKLIMKYILDYNDKFLNLHRLELEVFEDNFRAISLYEKFGFSKEGIKIDAAYNNGKYANMVMMSYIRR